MQWTNEGGGAYGTGTYGGEPYGGGQYGTDPYSTVAHSAVGYGGHAYGTASDAGAAQPPYAPAHQPAAPAHGYPGGVATAPLPPGWDAHSETLAMPLYDPSAGPDLAALSEFADFLSETAETAETAGIPVAAEVPDAFGQPYEAAVQLPQLPPGEAGETGAPDDRPVFVDASGRRQRRVLRAARLLVIPAGGYVALLISTMLGGPSVSSPLVPQSEAAHPAPTRATAPDTAPGTGSATASPSPSAAHDSAPTTRVAPSPTATRSATTATTATTATRAATTPKTTHRTTAPTSATTSAPVAKGRAVGSSHHPVK
ncbi:hypothetical protein [Streptomyces sp. NPDC127190]|uniref:hypothetical protein n=1 Tax=unclassified Streptomyces TaxID=2593676 RepID=UPI0036338948